MSGLSPNVGQSSVLTGVGDAGAGAAVGEVGEEGGQAAVGAGDAVGMGGAWACAHISYKARNNNDTLHCIEH